MKYRIVQGCEFIIVERRKSWCPFWEQLYFARTLENAKEWLASYKMRKTKHGEILVRDA